MHHLFIATLFFSKCNQAHLEVPLLLPLASYHFQSAALAPSYSLQFPSLVTRWQLQWYFSHCQAPFTAVLTTFLPTLHQLITHLGLALNSNWIRLSTYSLCRTDHSRSFLLTSSNPIAPTTLAQHLWLNPIAAVILAMLHSCRSHTHSQWRTFTERY